MTASARVGPAVWRAGIDEVLNRIAGRFGRVEVRHRVRAFVLGLLADLPRKNCWTIAEQVGDATPDGMQHLLARARWDTDGVAEDLRDYVVEHLGEPGAVALDLSRNRLVTGSFATCCALASLTGRVLPSRSSRLL